jgi:MFS transporter, putative metabolite:H+ symporter
MAALGASPIVVGILTMLLMPESVRWLISKGRASDARRIVARMVSKNAAELPAPAIGAAPPPVRLRDLYTDPGRFWHVATAWVTISTANYGVYLWGPSIVALIMAMSVPAAAHLFVWVAISGCIGKVAFSFLPRWLGRKGTGQLSGFGIAITLALAGIFHDATWNGIPAFIIFVAAGALFFDGGYCILTPYTAEIFPVRLAARGAGLGQASNGIGKIIGPLCLALIAGANNVVTPKATSGAVFHAFLFLAACGLVKGILQFGGTRNAGASTRSGLDQYPSGERTDDSRLRSLQVVMSERVLWRLSPRQESRHYIAVGSAGGPLAFGFS